MNHTDTLRTRPTTMSGARSDLVKLFLSLLPIVPAAMPRTATAQEPVPVGKGSYAASIPAGAARGKAEEADRRTLFLVTEDDRPVPSNKWYQNLVLQRFAVGLWPYPHRVDTGPHGLSIFYPTKWKPDGTELFPDTPLLLGGKDFRPADARAKDWTDWSVSFRMAESAGRAWDVTIAEGMPFTWVECRGVRPTLSFGAPPGAAGGKAGKGAQGVAKRETFRILDAAGKEVALPVTADALVLEHAGRAFGVFAPEGTRFEADGGADTLAVTFAAKATHLVIAPLPKAADLAAFAAHAHAVPRGTELSWDYDAAKGEVVTTWTVTTEALRGDEKRVLQGWLAHHWRESRHDLALDRGEYLTGRGRMRLAAGNRFTIAYPYHGIVPNLPRVALPADATTPSPAEARTAEYLRTHFLKTAFARDTYAGGKDLVRQLQAALIARATDDPNAKAIADLGLDELRNWLTYTPGEKDRFFAFYPRRKGLIGFNSSFGSEHFTDNHFHYGYYTFAAGLAAQLDPAFAKDYGGMAGLVARQYANWDRTDKRFPVLRTFDVWRGHSWADGNGFPDGNNQESTSEAVQSWAGLILLGEATGDRKMLATGVMGYAMETRAIREYWFNSGGDVFPAEWKHPIAGMIWSARKVWGTWFTADPAWIYGIQFIPTHPAASYLVRDPDAAKKHHEELIARYEAFQVREAARKKGATPKKGVTESFGGELGSYILGFRMMFDPAAVTAELDRLWNAPGDKVAHDKWMLGVHHQAHALVRLGRVDWRCHADSPTAMVYVHPTTGTRTFVAWNPGAEPCTVTFHEGGKILGRAVFAPRSLSAVTTLAARE